MKKRYKVLLVTTVILIILGITVTIIGKSMLAKIIEELESLKLEDISSPDLSMLDDGTYAGSFGNVAVAAVVEVTIGDHRIERIVLVDHRNGKGAAAEAILGTVIERQSLEVDVIAGATYSSLTILKAVEDALH